MKEGARGEANKSAISESAQYGHEQMEKENPLGFTRRDMVGQDAGIGFLYHKGDKWGFEKWSFENDDQESEPIREAGFVSDEENLSQEELDGLQEVARVPYSAYSVGQVNGKLTVVKTQRWDKDAHSEFRTAEGWKDMEEIQQTKERS